MQPCVPRTTGTVVLWLRGWLRRSRLARSPESPILVRHVNFLWIEGAYSDYFKFTARMKFSCYGQAINNPDSVALPHPKPPWPQNLQLSNPQLLNPRPELSNLSPQTQCLQPSPLNPIIHLCKPLLEGS